MELKIHRLAELFPVLSEENLTELIADISKNGQIEPVTILKDKNDPDVGHILDGRNRYLACQQLGIDTKCVEYQSNNGEPSEIELIAFVVSKNVKRRHLTIDQRAGLAALEVTSTVGNPNLTTGDKDSKKDGKKTTSKKNVTLGQAGKKHGVGRSKVSEARQLQKKDPEKLNKVIAGEKSLDQARKEAGLDTNKPADKQDYQPATKAGSTKTDPKKAAERRKARKDHAENAERQEAKDKVRTSLGDWEKGLNKLFEDNRVTQGVVSEVLFERTREEWEYEEKERVVETDIAELVEHVCGLKYYPEDTNYSEVEQAVSEALDGLRNGLQVAYPAFQEDIAQMLVNSLANGSKPSGRVSPTEETAKIKDPIEKFIGEKLIEHFKDVPAETVLRLVIDAADAKIWELMVEASKSKQDEQQAPAEQQSAAQVVEQSVEVELKVVKQAGTKASKKAGKKVVGVEITNIPMEDETTRTTAPADTQDVASVATDATQATAA